MTGVLCRCIIFSKCTGISIGLFRSSLVLVALLILLFFFFFFFPCLVPCKEGLRIGQDDGNDIVHRTLNLPIFNIHQCTLLSNVLLLHLYKLIKHVMLMVEVDQ